MVVPRLRGQAVTLDVFDWCQGPNASGCVRAELAGGRAVCGPCGVRFEPYEPQPVPAEFRPPGALPIDPRWEEVPLFT